ncbi:sensor histidine kinase [Paenactinomyces guangxiensis]|uniref:histidine kinase n=1 Tax=Paenactinomyces guangxiensis TaxID=1490290 RepID=A0A7W1WRH1_9BACL|nr:sensor histidine kinase [Paenactinomyces guangxiensis]MBA4494579.1 sensor histidine kinase [Paenactinomyces guangxiensis]MBH8591658.1 sensor histidine kinase [Paenactinomyces guangxiensis]
MKALWEKLTEYIHILILVRNRPLMVKLFVFSTFLVIFPILVVAVIAYYQSSVELEEETKRFSLQVIQQVETHIEYYLRDFEITNLKITNSPEMIAFLKIKNFHTTEADAMRKSVLSMLKNVKFSRADISNITVLLDNNQVVDTLGARNYYPAEKLRDEYWYPSVPKNGLPMLVSRTIKLKNKEEPVISMVRRLYSPDTLQPVGILVIDINFKRIEEMSDKVSVSRNGYFFILDSNGHYVYHPDPEKLGEKAEFTHLMPTDAKESGTFLLKNEKEEFFTYTFSPDLGWRFFTSTPYSDMTTGIMQIGKTLTWTVAISLVLAYVLGYGFATSLVRPIKRLQAFMKNVEIGNLSRRVKVETKDEIGQLSAGFNKMVEKLSRLLEEVYFARLRETEMCLRQKEMELKVLQSQINPHFLYNSLETMRGMALERDMEDLSMMASSLGQLLRYNLKHDSPTVALREELRFCEMYLQIQKYRFGDRFEYRFDIPDWATEMQVLKFSLQPFVENCFKHGIGSAAEKVKITISVARSSDSSFVILIKDTGTGMSAETLQSVRRNLNRTETAGGGPNIGIANVHRRIIHLFGSKFGVGIQSKPGTGTEIMIKMPMAKSKEEDYEQHLVGG